MVKQKTQVQKKDESPLEQISHRVIRWVGSIQSLLLHTALFIGAFLLTFAGYDFSSILLVVTTIVSLEAIYLSIFVQMTLNQHSDDLEEIQEDVEEISEDVEDIQEDVEGIEKDVDEIQKDVEEIQEDVGDIGEGVEEITEEDEDEDKRYEQIEQTLATLMEEIRKLKSPNAKK